MGYERVLADEIDAELDRLQALGQKWNANWITQAVCSRHEPDLPKAEASEFWRHGAYANTRETVRRRINARAGDRPDRDERQIRLPGYEHLQAYYVVRRKGDDVGLPIQKLTAAELAGKVMLYESMSASCAAHADELRRYIESRQSRRRRA